MADAVTIEVTSERVLATARGVLDGPTADLLRARLIAALPEAPFDLIIDLRAIVEVQEAGVDGMVRAHEAIAPRARRSAYVVERPRVRALVFKLIHGTQDEHTRPVSTLDMAEKWLREPTPQAFADASLERARSLLARFQAKIAGREVGS